MGNAMLKVLVCAIDDIPAGYIVIVAEFGIITTERPH
jgi:hypothetical protein